MAVKTSTPWWVSGLLALGLVSLFSGERVLAHLDTVSSALTFLGLLLIAGSTALRAWAFTRDSGSRKKVEGVLLLSHAGVILSLVVYYLFGTDGGREMLGIESPRAPTLALVVWVLIMGISLWPLLMTEVSLGITGRDNWPKPSDKRADDAAVELFRVREMATSGLTLALAAAFLMVTCNVAKERDVREDVSYFKTSQPGTATISIVGTQSEPVRVLLFFPEVNQVGDEVEAYFRQLDKLTGKVQLERHDRMVSPGLAKDFKVNADGTIVIVKGETAEEKAKREAQADEDAGDGKDKDGKDKDKPKKPEVEKVLPANEKFQIPTDFKRARSDKLRELDSEVQKILMKVIRAKRIAYFSVGHGELNDPKTAGIGDAVDPQSRSAIFKQILTILNYEIKSWDGFGKPVPDDATLLVVLGPRQPLLGEDLQAIDDYLDEGGALFIALDPRRDADLGVLEGRLGVKFDKTPVADDKDFFVARRNASDHRIIVTNQFSSHASVTTLSRAGVKAGIPMAEAGNLVDADFMVEQGGNPPKRTYVIKTMESAFLDKSTPEQPQGNNAYDQGSEARKRYNLVAAVEDPSKLKRSGNKPKPKPEGEEGKEDASEASPGRGMRALVFADVDIFDDQALSRFGGLQYVVRDAALWLGGEEELAGETETEKDVHIEHTKSEDVVWFYLSLVGAPLVVLSLGVGGVMWRRRRAQRRRS